MEHLIFAAYLILAAFTFAKVEIEIEGPHGWASNLPTWRIQNKWTEFFYGHRPLTGYHLWLQLFVMMMAHLPVALNVWNWSWSLELRLIGFVIIFFITEDFLWFIVNPAYGLSRFRARHIWWHEKTWWWFMPRDYWVFFVIGIAAYWAGIRLR
jgi:hypothetical protein